MGKVGFERLTLEQQARLGRVYQFIIERGRCNQMLKTSLLLIISSFYF
jgi:hypothetical protein